MQHNIHNILLRALISGCLEGEAKRRDYWLGTLYAEVSHFIHLSSARILLPFED